MKNENIQTWYRTSKFNWHISPVEAVKQTEKSLLLKAYHPAARPRREPKHSLGDDYWPTVTEAVEYLHTRAVRKKAALEKELAEVNKALEEFSGLLKGAPAVPKCWCNNCKHAVTFRVNGIGMWICDLCRMDVTPNNYFDEHIPADQQKDSRRGFWRSARGENHGLDSQPGDEWVSEGSLTDTDRLRWLVDNLTREIANDIPFDFGQARQYLDELILADQ